MAIVWGDKDTGPRVARTVAGQAVETVVFMLVLAVVFGALPWLVQP